MNAYAAGAYSFRDKMLVCVFIIISVFVGGQCVRRRRFSFFVRGKIYVWICSPHALSPGVKSLFVCFRSARMPQAPFFARGKMFVCVRSVRTPQAPFLCWIKCVSEVFPFLFLFGLCLPRALLFVGASCVFDFFFL